MKKTLIKIVAVTALTVLTALPGISFALQATDNKTIFDGYYA